MSIGPSIPEIQHFQNLTSIIQGQDHGWGECWKSQSGCNILSIHIAFVPCQSALPFLRYSIFKIWPWKFKVKVMGEVDIESHKVDVTSYRLTSLSSMSIGHPIPEILLFQYLTLKIQGQGHGWGERWQSQSGCSILSIQIPFVPCQSALPILRYSIFKIWPWKSKVKVKWPWLHNYRSRQFHRTRNGINPSSGFRDMGSAKSDPSAASFDKFLAQGQAHIGQMGK